MKNIIIAVIFLSIGIWICNYVYKENMRIKDWYPRITWQEFLKEQNYAGCITDIYIKNGFLEIGINGKIIHSSPIEIK